MDKLERMLKGKIPAPETGIEVRKSICVIDDPATQCGLDCYVQDGRIIKVEGSLENPHSGGTLCAKGCAYRQYVYHEDRLRSPMKRTGPRGSGEFSPISWDEALETIASNMNRLKKESGPESVIFFVGYPKQMRPFVSRLAMQYGSPNFCTESSTCFKAMDLAWKLVYGTGAGPDVRNTRCLLVWPNNLFHCSTPMARGVLDARDRGMKIILVDPRKAPFSRYADIHLRPWPGTDGALALGMANVIIAEGLHDQEFVAEYSKGFDEFRQYVTAFDPKHVEELTGVPAGKMVEAACLFASTKPAAIMPSAAPVVQQTNGLQNYRAVFILSGLTGNFDVAGGNMVSPWSWLEVPGGFTSRENEFAMSTKLSDLPLRTGERRFPVWGEMTVQGQSMDIQRHIRTGDPYPLRGLIAFGMNYRMFPDSEGFLEAIQQLDFICDIDLFLTDTSRYADIVLPAASSVERSEFRCYPQKYVIFTQPVIEPLGEARSDVEIAFELAHRLGLDDPLLNPTQAVAENGFDAAAAHEAAMDWILEPSGMTVAELKKHPGGMFVPNPPPNPERKYEQTGFHTPSGKMEFTSSVLAKYTESNDYAALPVYRPPGYKADTTSEFVRQYPLVLNAGSRLPMFQHSRMFRVPWARSLRPEAAADLNPSDARKMGISQGDRIEIATPKGAIRVVANVTEMTRPGVVNMLHDYPEANVNTIIEADHLDSISGFPAFRAVACSVRKVDQHAETADGKEV